MPHLTGYPAPSTGYEFAVGLSGLQKDSLLFYSLVAADEHVNHNLVGYIFSYPSLWQNGYNAADDEARRAVDHLGAALISWSASALDLLARL